MSVSLRSSNRTDLAIAWHVELIGDFGGQNFQKEIDSLKERSGRETRERDRSSEEIRGISLRESFLRQKFTELFTKTKEFPVDHLH